MYSSGCRIEFGTWFYYTIIIARHLGETCANNGLTFFMTSIHEEIFLTAGANIGLPILGIGETSRGPQQGPKNKTHNYSFREWQVVATMGQLQHFFSFLS